MKDSEAAALFCTENRNNGAKCNSLCKHGGRKKKTDRSLMQLVNPMSLPWRESSQELTAFFSPCGPQTSPLSDIPP